MDPVRRRHIPAPVSAFAAFFAIASSAMAQAWIPPRGFGSVSLSYQRISNTGHKRSNGFLVEAGQSLNMGLYLEAEYSLTERLSLAAGLPYVFGKSTTVNPPSATAGNPVGRTSDLPPATTWFTRPTVLFP
jgi:hypothetical protein